MNHLLRIMLNLFVMYFSTNIEVNEKIMSDLQILNVRPKLMKVYQTDLLKLLTYHLRRFSQNVVCQLCFRGATGIYFFEIYLFIEDLLGFINCINISGHPHCEYACMHQVVSIFQRTHTAGIYACTEGLYEIYLKMYGDLLKNFKKINPGSCWFK